MIVVINLNIFTVRTRAGRSRSADTEKTAGPPAGASSQARGAGGGRMHGGRPRWLRPSPQPRLRQPEQPVGLWRAGLGRGRGLL